MCFKADTASVGLCLGCLLHHGSAYLLRAGSRFGDFCAWCWCPVMALCQETRTLAANNVEAGVWHGRSPPPRVKIEQTAISPPKVSVMTDSAASQTDEASAVDTVLTV